MRIQRLQTRIIVFFVALLALVQVAAFWFVNAANSGNARAKVEEELNVGQRVFARLLEQNADKLKLSARVLAADFAFREAIATHDSRTISSVLANHGARIGADAMVFVDLDGNVVADTLRPHAQAHAFEFPALIRPGSGANAAMEVLDDRAFQLVSVPVLAPVSIGWVVMGFAVDDSLARDLRQLTELEVSFALENAGAWQVFASTLAAPEQQSLLAAIPQKSTVVSRRVLDIGGVDHQALVIPLDRSERTRIVAVLHRSLADALAAFGRLRNTLIVLAVLSLVLSIVGSVMVARNITRPLEALAGAAARIEQGDYVEPVTVELPGTRSGKVTLNRAVIQKGLERQLVYYWFAGRGRQLTGDFAARFANIVDGLRLGRTDGGLVRVITPIGDDGVAAADARLARFLAASVDELPRFIPG